MSKARNYSGSLLLARVLAVAIFESIMEIVQ